MGKEEYYKRQPATHVDGSRIFVTAEDEAKERTVAEQVATRWRCDVHRFAKLAPIDYYAERDGRVVGLFELKNRDHASTTYDTVYLSLRKWLALLLAETGLGVPALFVVQFTDGVWWCKARDVNPREHGVSISGATFKPKKESDVEPVIEVPIAMMTELGARPMREPGDEA